MFALTQAQARDEIRRRFLGITPPIDSGTGNVGDAPANRPDPSNAVLNGNIAAALSQISRQAKFKENDVIFQGVTAQATNGRYIQPLETLGGLTNTAGVNSVRRVVWDDGSGNLVPLTPTSREEYTQRYGAYENVAPAPPQWYWTEGYNLAILPSPNAAGTLRVIAGSSPTGPVNDVDTIHDLPADYHNAIWRGAAVLFWQSKASDADAQAKLSMHLPLWTAEIEEIAAWNADVNQNYQLTIGWIDMRRGQGLRRNRR